MRKLLDLGANLSFSGRIDDAIEALNVAKKAAMDIQEHDLAAEALEGLCRQSWANANSLASLEYAHMLLKLKLRSTSTWRIQGFLRLARALTALGRPLDALQTLHDATKECDYTRLGSLSTYLEVRAYAEHGAHMRTASLRDYQLATDIAAALQDGWASAFMLNNFGVAAGELGEPNLAHEVHSRAISVASDQKLGWVIAYAKLTYAQSLLLFGCFHRARELLNEVSSDGHRHPSVLIKGTWIRGLLDSIATKAHQDSSGDEAMVDIVFKSSEPARICPMVVAYHRMYLARGEKTKARKILSKALSGLKSSAFAVWLLLEVIRYGTLEQLVQSTKLLEDRGSEDHVANGLADLAEARAAALRGDATNATRSAGQSEAIFRKCGLHYPEVIAMELGGRLREAYKAYKQLGAETEAQRLKSCGYGSQGAVSLTGRQQEVVRLVVGGKDLRQIAKLLGIREKTAEHHLAAAMQSLGVRRRVDLRLNPDIAYLI